MEDSSNLMRDGVRARIAALARATGGRTQRWSSQLLLGVLSAGAFGPLLTAGVGGPALVSAAVGAVTAVGGNVLTDIVKAGVERLGADASPEDLTAELEQAVQRVLEEGGRRSEALRAEIAAVLREIGAVGVAVEEAVRSGDRELQAALTAGLAELGGDFAEFGFVLAELDQRLRLIRESVDRQSADLQLAVGLQYRQATDTRLLLEQVSAIERRTRPVDSDGSLPGVRWAHGSPYRGLLPFGESDSEVFHGREEITAELISFLSQRLSGPGLVVVTGASGAGKSSLLRAGLLPAVGRGELSEEAREWPLRVINQPTRSPLSRLAVLLAGLAGVDAPSALRGLTDDPRQAHLLVCQGLEADARRRGTPTPARLMLIIDQFEEVFSLGGADAERSSFLAALGAITESGAALVILAVRGDFVDRCAAHPLLAAALQRGPFIVGPMSGAQLRRAITGPADAAGLAIEPGLVDVILAELGSGADGYGTGVLPLVSQTMLTIWDHREEDRLTSRGYARTGGVRRAVATSAEEAYADLSAPQRELARELFRGLTVVGRDGALARRPLPRSSFPEAAGSVLETFSRRRLVILDADAAQIAHDVLLHAWPRLREWLEDDVSNLALYSAFTADAEEWAANGRDPSFLYRGTQLGAVHAALPSWASEVRPLDGVAAEFLTTADNARRRTVLARRALVFAAAVVVVLIAASALVAVRAADSAEQEHTFALARLLASQSELVSTADPALSARLAAAAYRTAVTPETELGLLNVYRRPYRGELPVRKGSINAVAASPDGRVLVTALDDGTVRFWDIVARRPLGGDLSGPVVRDMEISPDGTTLALAIDDEIRLFDLATRKPRVKEPLSIGAVTDMAFTPDGRTLAVLTSSSAEVRFWNLERKRVETRLSGGPGGFAKRIILSRDGAHLAVVGVPYESVTVWSMKDLKKTAVVPGSEAAFSPDGEYLAAGSSFRPVRLYDVKTGRAAGSPLHGITGNVKAVEFSPDGTTLATVSWDEPNEPDKVGLWDVATGRQAGSGLAGPAEQVDSVLFSPDGRTLMTIQGSAVLFWDARHSHSDIVPTGEVTGTAAFSPDGRTLATAGDSARLWDVASRRALGPPLPGRLGATLPGVVFSPDGRSLAASGEKDTVLLWDTADQKPIGAPLTAGVRQANSFGGDVRAIAFSPDGRTLATGDDTRILLWDTATRTLKASLPTRQKGIVFAAAFSPDGRMLATVNETDVQFWDVTTHRLRFTLTTSHRGTIRALAFSPDGRRLATASHDGTVRLWDVATRRPVGGALVGHNDEIFALAFSPDGRTLASGGGDRAVRLWDVAAHRAQGVPLTGHGDYIFSIAFSPDGSKLVTAGREKGARLWDVGRPGDLPGFVCSVAGRSLTAQEWDLYAPDEDYRPACG
ncbi:PD40 domain-containing protein [Microbispora sp. RL4-1S]|uniref:PD40 domain-containing protein n=1 Tax=Microbispora oryzae TaxID=2806554 RepID=A0A940WKM3_9ACTN|nr:AAA family ATPase [Microbispora oryzae]MBP2707419.1 PD40 domain-containing protein [Microbispora oryzae]